MNRRQLLLGGSSVIGSLILPSIGVKAQEVQEEASVTIRRTSTDVVNWRRFRATVVEGGSTRIVDIYFSLCLDYGVKYIEDFFVAHRSSFNPYLFGTSNKVLVVYPTSIVPRLRYFEEDDFPPPKIGIMETANRTNNSFVASWRKS
jgi:hypothetical protein